MAFERTVCFSSFRLDLPNQQLWGGAEPVRLRPKTFAVLRYLVEHAGRLVTRDDLVRAVWPDTRGAEKGPKRCILELRTALGDRADDPQFIETVGRLGYRLIAPLATTAPARSPETQGHSLGVPEPSTRPPVPNLVGRELQLAKLHRWLEETLSGQRRVVFVTGEPGIGKTSVVETFLHQVETGRRPRLEADDPWVGCGQCIEHYGEGEAYLPVLEALGPLAARPGNTVLLDLLRRYAPSWLAQLPSLVSEAELETLQHRMQGATPQRMLREIANVISALTARVPLILVIEDLHWSDYSTLDFLSSVTQGRDPARLLLIATYRSTDMASHHPLRPVTQELLSHGQARELPLAGITSTAVEQYLDTRFPQHLFPANFAPLLHLWTEGNPLFLVNLVEDLVAQELLSQKGGLWTLRIPAETIVARVPENSRRLIEKQMARLAPEIQPLLEAASIAGAEFAAELVASALGADAERIEERCEELARHELFLRRVGMEEWPDGTRTASYGFRHTVYQQLWSERVPTQRRQRFHLRIGERQEQSYGSRAGEIAAELAIHFGEGRDYRRAARYHHRAAENALQRSAHREAIDHLSKGLEMVVKLPETPERSQQELALQIVLGVPLTATMGYAAPEVEQAYSRALELSEQVRETSPIVQALLGLWVFYFVRAELDTARRLAERCLQQAQQGQTADFGFDAHNALGDTLLWLGELTSAREHLERGLSLRDPRRDRSYVFYDVTNPEVGCLSHLAWALWYLGYPDQALKRSDEALALARRLAHPYSLGYALNFAAALHCFRREARQTRERAETTLTLSGEQGFPLWLAMGTILRSWARVEQGEGEEGLPQIQQGLAAFQAIGAGLGRTAFLALLAESYGRAGQADEGLRVLTEALAVAERNGERLYEAEIHRLRGELTLHLKDGARSPGTGPHGKASPLKSQLSRTLGREVEGYFVKAIAVARAQQAKSWELRAAVSLSRLWRRQGRIAEAHALLSPLYGWFTEGFDTPDLREANNLLHELSQELR